MKAGIYFSGLGQSFNQENVEKYAARLINEMRFAKGKAYSCRVEKVKYSGQNESTVVSIYEDNVKDGRLVYKMYEFNYYRLLTSRFESFNILKKNLYLLLLVVKKFPIALWRLVSSNNYSHRFQSFYVFTIFFVVAISVFISIPSAIALIADYSDGTIKAIAAEISAMFGCENNLCITEKNLRTFTQLSVSVTAILVFIVPQAKSLLLNLATEFVCANNYLEYGERRQVIQGNLELLVAYIKEHDNCKIHYHTYSFGSLVAIDYLFPMRHPLSANALQSAEALITIASPAEFVKAYYPGYFLNRTTVLDGSVKWLNVYSVNDALATNFRKDGKAGEAHFGLMSANHKPENLNYEIQTPGRWGLIDFVTLYPIRVHGMYWDTEPSGQSSLRLVYQEMEKHGLFN